MSNMFSKAKATPVTKTKTKGKAKREVEIAGLEDLAQVQALIASLEAVAKTLASDVKDKAVDEFVREGMAINRRPDNWRGVDGVGSASVELRKRSTRSKLTAAEQEQLTAAGISFGEAVTTEERFVINPAYMNDQALLEKASNAMSKVKGMPEDFITLQAKQSHSVATEATLNEVFALDDAAKVRELVAVAGTLALKPKLEATDIEATLASVKKLLG